MTYKIIYSKKSCIGAGECEKLSKEYWKVNNKGLAELKDAVLNEATGDYELLITDEDYERERKVAGSCPVSAIKIIKIE